jgi:uncharacterized protein YecA (UPF0149 family)
MPTLAESVADYCTSELFLFVNPSLKEHAAPVLAAWCGMIGGAVTAATIDASLKDMARLDAPAEVRRAVPSLLTGFFDYLTSIGGFPQAAQWARWVKLCEKEYAARFRDDGSVRGGTFEKKYSDVGRNDPCPCGSGKKFKKCCMGLL